MKRKIMIVFGFLCLLGIIASITWTLKNRTINEYVKDMNITLDTTDKYDDTAIRIGTYNIKSLNMGESLFAFKEDVKDLQLDIIVLQEVDQKAQRSMNLDMMKELSKHTEYPYYHFYPTMWLFNGYYGLGILSRYPIERVSSMPLPNGFWKEPRILASADININGELLHVYNTHLSFESKRYRNEQALFLQNYFKNRERTILLGDFNTFRDNSIITMDNMLSVNSEEPFFLTFRDFGHPDNIYYSADLRMENVAMKSSSFSDHHLLYGDFYLQP